MSELKLKMLQTELNNSKQALLSKFEDLELDIKRAKRDISNGVKVSDGTKITLHSLIVKYNSLLTVLEIYQA